MQKKQLKLSKENAYAATYAAWAMEFCGVPKWEVEKTFDVSRTTLNNYYRRFGMPLPKEYRKNLGKGEDKKN